MPITWICLSVSQIWPEPFYPAIGQLYIQDIVSGFYVRFELRII